MPIVSEVKNLIRLNTTNYMRNFTAVAALSGLVLTDVNVVKSKDILRFLRIVVQGSTDKFREKFKF